MTRSNAEELNIEINLMAEAALASLSRLSTNTADFAQLVENAGAKTQALMDATGISYGLAASKIQQVNKELGMVDPTLLTSALKQAESIRQSTLRVIQEETIAENKLADAKMRSAAISGNMVERVVQKRAELEVDKQGLEYERLKAVEAEKAEAIQNRQISLENKETQEYREQLALMQRMATEDAKRLANDGRGMLFSPGQPAPVMPNSMSTGRFAGQYGKFDTGAGTAMYDSWKNVGPMLQETGKKAEGAARGFNVLRTAAGFLTAMILSKIATGITQVFQKIIDSAAQAEQAFLKLAIAQKAISRGGTAISSNELLGIIDKVAAAYLSVSKIDAQKMVSSLAVLTKDLKLSASEYEKMAMAIPLIAQQAGVSIESATDQVITGLTKSGRGWADLGITVDAAIIRQKAISEGLVKNAESYEALTAEQKQQVEVLALLEILEENTIDNKAKQEAYNNTLSGSQVALNAAWEDFAATLGKFAAPTIIQFLQELTRSLQAANEWLDKNKTSVAELSAQFSGLAAVGRAMQALGGQNNVGGIIGAILLGGMDIEKIFNDAYEQTKKYQRDTFELTDGRVDKGARDDFAPIGGVSPEDEAKMQEALDKFAQEMAELELKSAQEREDIAIELGRDLVDIETEYDRKRADVQRDYNDKVRDINQGYNEDIADIKQKQAEDEQKRRNDDLKREQEYQNKLLEMRENYLMSLEDALHSRDARQVLKLMRQYELDKLQAARRHEIDKQQSAADEKLRRQEVINEVKKAQNKREIALKEAQQERDDKLAQMKIDEKREIEDARLKAKRKNDDLRKANADRAALMAAQLAWEQRYTGEWMTRMLRLYGQYYTNIARVYSNLRALQRAGASALGGGGIQTSPNNGGTMGGGFGPQFHAAEGGIFSASSPTTLRFGEAGAEVASVMPLNRIGKNVGKLMSGSLPGGSGAGKMTIELLLSPDLESRIVANSLDQTANIITSVQRSKSKTQRSLR